MMRSLASFFFWLGLFVPASAQGFGTIEGEFIAKWLDDGRSMELLQPVHYTGPDGSKWTAPKGAVTDGASIPSSLWSVVGSPFSGKYRTAAVIHDYYCETKSRPWKSVHKTFYTASRAAGVGATKANIMYFAVYRFGPRWQSTRSDDPSEIVFKPRIIKSEFDAMRAKIETGELGLSDIEAAADRSLKSASRSIIE